jgi:lipopolysaccharide transport system permease protein
MFNQQRTQQVPAVKAIANWQQVSVKIGSWAFPLILILGICLRIWVTVDWNGYQPDSVARLVGDETGYNNMARELLQGYGFTWPGRVPFYPIWLASLYLLTNGSYIGVTYLQIVPGLMVIAFTYWLGCTIFNRWTGLLAAFLASVSYVLIHQGLHLLSEVLYTPVILLVTWVLFSVYRHPDKKRFALLGGLIGVSNLIRPSMLMFPFFLTFLLLFVFPWRKALTYGPIMITVSLLVITPWIVHNYEKYDAIFALQTSNAILWQGSPEYYHLIHDEEYTYIQIWSEVLYGPGWQEHDPNSVSGDKYWTDRAIASIKSEPLTYLKFAVEKSVTFWVGDPNADWGDTRIYNYQALRQIGFLPQDAVQVMIARLIPIVAAIAFILLRSRWKQLWPLMAFLAYFTLLHAATHAEVRLSESLQPLLLIAIAGAIESFWKKKQEMTSMVNSPHLTIYLRDLLRELVARDMKLRYKGSLLGIAWSLLNPLAQLLVFGFIFRFVLPLNIPNYTAFLFSGLLVWSWFQSSLFSATTTIVDGRSLIKRPGFPAAILPVVTVMSNLVHFLLALPVLLLFLVITGVPLHGTILLLPFVILIQGLFILSLAYFLATFHVTFRDTQHLVGVVLLLFFYLTPIFYDASIVPEKYQLIYRLNPILHIMDAYRAILIRGELPATVPMLLLTAVSTILLLLGYRTFINASYAFVEEL